MAENEVVETSEAQIAVHWGEEEYYYPSNPFIAQANMTDEGIYDRFSLDNFPNCFKAYADLLDWYEYWHTILDTSDAPCWKWFVDRNKSCTIRSLKKFRFYFGLITAARAGKHCRQLAKISPCA